MIIPIYKPAGWTPVQTIEHVRMQRPELKSLKMACAGRLDPMAEGVLVMLSGESLNDFDAYCRMDKEYEADILLGLGSDSWDVMGIVEREMGTKEERQGGIEIEDIESVWEQFEGRVTMPLPPYSAASYQGKPLYWWARRGLLPQGLPEREMQIYSITFDGMGVLSGAQALRSVTERIGRVKGDFRQQQILARWREVVHNDIEVFRTAHIRIHCASGTYIRSLAHVLGQRLGTGALLYRLVRTRVGEYVGDFH